MRVKRRTPSPIPLPLMEPSSSGPRCTRRAGICPSRPWRGSNPAYPKIPHIKCFDVGRRTLQLGAPVFPPASEGDPQRHRDEFHIETEAAFADIEAIVPELVSPRDIPRRVDLGEPRQPGQNLL